MNNDALTAARTKLNKARALLVDAENAGRTGEAEAAFAAMRRLSKKIRGLLAA